VTFASFFSPNMATRIFSGVLLVWRMTELLLNGELAGNGSVAIIQKWIQEAWRKARRKSLNSKKAISCELLGFLK
jgi:hypothetical protein